MRRDDSVSQVQALTEPHPSGSYLTGNVLKNEFANKTTNPALQKKQDPDFFLCQKLWTCWLSILRTKLLLNFNLLFFFFFNPD